MGEAGMNPEDDPEYFVVGATELRDLQLSRMRMGNLDV